MSVSSVPCSEFVGEGAEIVIGTPGAVERLIVDVELVSGPSELTEYLMQPDPQADVVWGPFAAVEEPDSVTVVLVDADGIVSPHPH